MSAVDVPRRKTGRAVEIVSFVRRMRGQTQPRLMRGADGIFYVVKFRNNPLGPRALANDWLGSWLALHIGLPVPQPVLVELSRTVVQTVPEMDMTIDGQSRRCAWGTNYGST